MVSAKEESAAAAAAAQQLGSMSLGDSVERKEDDTTPTVNNGTPTKTLCSACGKESNTVKKCNGCLCVWYCDKECQNKHRKEHRKECKLIKKELDKRGGKLDLGTELDIGPLPDLPPQEECPICMRVLPIHATLQAYNACCGKLLCCACDHQHQIKTDKENEKRAQKKQPHVPLTCAFCRTAMPGSDEEILARTRKRAELKDPSALYNLAMKYGSGKNGLSVDQAKCIELLRESAGLGFPDALYQLGAFYATGMMGLEQNKEKGFKNFKEAAKEGDVFARHNIGVLEKEAGDFVASMSHWRLSAAGGYRKSMGALISRFEYGFLHHGDLAETLQAFYRSRAELKSKDRDEYIKHLKMTGNYLEEYEC